MELEISCKEMSTIYTYYWSSNKQREINDYEIRIALNKSSISENVILHSANADTLNNEAKVIV